MMPPTGPDLCYALAARKTARYVGRLYDTHLASTGLSISQFSILSLLEAHGRLKISELADMLIMERTSLVRALKPLQVSGWVATQPSGSGRAFDITLARAGRKKIAEAAPLWKTAQSAFEAEIGRDRAIRLRDEVLDLNLGG